MFFCVGIVIALNILHKLLIFMNQVNHEIARHYGFIIKLSYYLSCETLILFGYMPLLL